MKEEKNINQPSVDLQNILDDIMSKEPTEFVFRGKKRSLGWITKGGVREFTHVMMKEKNESKRNVKLCAIILLNNIWKIRFFYPIYWRYLYYICDLDDVEVLRALDACKKKIPSAPSSLVTILATGMMDVMMTMTRSEASAIQAEQAGERPTA